jgi:hypothetical protein
VLCSHIVFYIAQHPDIQVTEYIYVGHIFTLYRDPHEAKLTAGGGGAPLSQGPHPYGTEEGTEAPPAYNEGQAIMENNRV